MSSPKIFIFHGPVKIESSYRDWCFIVRPKFASEFDFSALILSGRTAGIENKFKNFCLFYSQLYEQIMKNWSVVHVAKTESANI